MAAAFTVVRHNPDPAFDNATAVLQALAQEPSAVVYDLTFRNETVLLQAGVFDALDHYLTLCSGTPLLVCSGESWLTSALPSHPLGRRVTYWPSLDAALTTARYLPPLDRYSLDLDSVKTAPRQARYLVSQALERWQVPELVGMAWSVISELVTNAVVHAAPPITASISRPQHDHGTIRLAVRDGDSALPVQISHKLPLTADGHGIWLVNSIARGWGTVPLHPGKIVWAVLS